MECTSNCYNSPPPPPPPSAPVSLNGSAAHGVSKINNYDDDDVSNNNGNDSGTKTRGSIAERRAVKCGFKAERISTSRFRTDAGFLSSPVVPSPLLTIPPGISPTALLDSPIFLPNCQPSPTTGTFPAPFSDDGFGSSFRVKAEKVLDDDGFPEFSSLVNRGSNGDLQTLVLARQPVNFEFPMELPKGATAMMSDGDSVTSTKVLESKSGEFSFCDSENRGPDMSVDQNHQQEVPACGGYMEKQLPEERKENIPAADVGRTSEDGYCWRKYGQKQVKGSEYPRSYYKCTHPNCQVKKKIERSHDGEITEIIYKGAHNHPKPQPNRRAAAGLASSFDGVPEMEEDSGTSVKPEGFSAWSSETGSKDMKVGSDRRLDGLERTSSTSVVTELSDPLSTTHGRSVGAFESVGTPELSSTLASLDDNDDDGTTQASISLSVDADDEESESKRRKLDGPLVETYLTSRAVREPRVVVQIESEVDILDDGYRWRKYGQKVVKGNPNPRSYYKCTSPGCSVRKHVERASHNLKYVITTYEGKHNHEVPAARNSNQTNSSRSNLPPNPPNAQPGMALGRHTNGPKPEPHIQDYTLPFDSKPMFNNAYLRPSFPRSFGNEVRLGVSSIYSMKLPSIQNPMPYGPIGCNSNHAAMHHSGSIASLVPDFPISVASCFRPSANVSLPNGDFNSNGNLVGPVQPFLSGQQLIRPKQEHKDKMYDFGPPIVDQANVPSSPSSSLYQHIMGNFSS